MIVEFICTFTYFNKRLHNVNLSDILEQKSFNKMNKFFKVIKNSHYYYMHNLSMTTSVLQIYNYYAN